MAKRRKKSERSGAKTTSRLPETGGLEEQLRQLSVDQLVDIVVTFFDGLDEKHRLEFMNLLPSVQAEDMERELPYGDDEEFLWHLLGNLSAVTQAAGGDVLCGLLPADDDGDSSPG